jgi:hypothetical protein
MEGNGAAERVLRLKLEYVNSIPLTIESPSDGQALRELFTA